MKKPIIAFLQGFICTACILLGISTVLRLYGNYEKDVDAVLPPRVIYQHNTAETALSADIRAYLSEGDLSLYFGELPPKNEAIEISIFRRSTLFVYPLDEDSMLIDYLPHHGIRRVYKKSGFGDFNSLLRALYECTGKEGFNTAVEYQN